MLCLRELVLYCLSCTGQLFRLKVFRLFYSDMRGGGVNCNVSVLWLSNMQHVIFVKTLLWNADLHTGLFSLPGVHIDLYEVSKNADSTFIFHSERNTAVMLVTNSL